MIGMPQVDREEDRARDDAPRVRAHRHHADRRARIRQVVHRDPVDLGDQLGGADQRILAALHRRRAGVGFHARDIDVEHADALHALHDADRLLLGLEDRALLDMGLEEGADLAPAAFHLTGIADALQLLADRLALGVRACQALLEAELAAEHARRDHRGREAVAFLVGPGRDLDRGIGLVAEIVEPCGSPRGRRARRRCRRTCRRSVGCRCGSRSSRAAANRPCRRGARKCCPSCRPARCSPPPRTS